MRNGTHTMTVFRRELKGYFTTPVAYVFLVVFLVLTGFLTFTMGAFFERGQANLIALFELLPWVFLLLVPAATMGLWAEERRSGTLELLLTMPITLTQAVVGKFLAAWTFLLVALALTFPYVLTVAWLGDPDWGRLAAGYVGTFLLSGATVAIGSLASALTRSVVVSFVISLLACLLLLLAGYEPVTSFFTWAPASVVNVLASISLLPHYRQFVQGVIDLRDVLYFLSIVLLAGYAAHVVLSCRKV